MFNSKSMLLVLLIACFATVLFAQNVSSQEAMEFEKINQQDLVAAQKLFEKLEGITGVKTVETVLEPLNDLQIILDRRMWQASLYQNVHPDPDMRSVSEKYEQEFAKIVTQIEMSRPIYDALAELDLKGEDDATRYYVDKLLTKFKRAGVDKDPQTREKIRQLQEELLKTEQEFSRNIREDVRTIALESVEDLAGMPQDFIDNHQPGQDGKIYVSTDRTDYIPFLSYAHSDKHRSDLYKQNGQRGYPENVAVLKKLLNSRYELATLLGYKNWADYVTEDKMIESAQKADAFIDEISNLAQKRADQEYKELLKRLQQDQPQAKKIGAWQKEYLQEAVKREKYNFNSQELRPYFPYETVKQGLFDITGQMFGLSYKKVDIPVWHPSVEAYELWRGDELVGRFYFDMHPRPEKYQHAMMTEVVTGIAGRQIPEAALVCNFPGGDGTDGLMEHTQVTTFFHEMGHLLHHLLGGEQRWIGISGITTEWDFVEMPSKLLEEWAWDLRILKSFAKNTDGEPIPEVLVRKMLRLRKYGLGLNTEQQLFYSAISLNLHNRDPHTFSCVQLLQKLQAQYSPYDYVPRTYMYLAFGHLTDYSAIYYTYIWSEVIAKDVFSEFKKNGLLNKDIANAYLEKVLKPGGSKPAADLVKDFLGRNYNSKAFAKELNAG